MLNYFLLTTDAEHPTIVPDTTTDSRMVYRNYKRKYKDIRSITPITKSQADTYISEGAKMHSYILTEMINQRKTYITLVTSNGVKRLTETEYMYLKRRFRVFLV